MKHLVTSGCSFTISDGNHPHGIGIGNRTWAWNLDDILKNIGYKFNFHNVGISGGGNRIISMNCIDTITSLLNDNVQPEEIFVIIQWSGLFRPCVYTDISTAERKIPFNEIHTTHSKLKDMDFSKATFIDTAGQISNHNPIWLNYLESYYSMPAAFVDTIEIILKTQWFLDSKKIKYKMFAGWDIFTTFYKKSGIFGSDKMVNVNQFGNEKYVNKKNVLLKDIYPYSDVLWDMVEWDNFWFFENDIVKYGGLTQWVQNNLEFQDWYVRYPRDPHPPSRAAKKFTEQVVLPIVLQNIN
tara:strand:+ start:125 stop:1015 length:891 start_codon:yes stop_codon:yes gene_type:complete